MDKSLSFSVTKIGYCFSTTPDMAKKKQKLFYLCNGTAQNLVHRQFGTMAGNPMIYNLSRWDVGITSGTVSPVDRPAGDKSLRACLALFIDYLATSSAPPDLVTGTRGRARGRAVVAAHTPNEL
jgi:hypothetical protein